MVPNHICTTLSSCCYKGHIGEVIASSIIITKSPLIRDIPHWVSREAGPAGRSSKAGGARAAGQAGQSSNRAALFDGQGSWISKAKTSTDVLGSKIFSTLVTI